MVALLFVFFRRCGIRVARDAWQAIERAPSQPRTFKRYCASQVAHAGGALSTFSRSPFERPSPTVCVGTSARLGAERCGRV